MSDINDLLEPRRASNAPTDGQPTLQTGAGFEALTSPPASDTGGFSAFIIAALSATVGVMFFVIWAAFTIPMIVAISGMDRSGFAPLLILLAIALGFFVAVCTTGFAVLILDIRKQLVAIRRSLSGR